MDFDIVVYFFYINTNIVGIISKLNRINRQHYQRTINPIGSIIGFILYIIKVQMNHIDIGQVFQALETFILLKRQNLVIYSWILFKKNLKKASIQTSRSRSLYSDAINNRYTRVFAPNEHSYSNQILLSDPNNNSTPNIMRSNKRIATENAMNQPEDDRQANKNMATNRYTLTEKPTFQQLNYAMHTETEQVEDSQEFEDIVLDRLSKLQENINKLMREKRTKDQKRGYVGMPINNPYQSRTPHPHFHSSFEDYYLDVDKKFSNIIERRKAFFESLQKNPVDDHKNVIYNLKYIPVIKDGQKAADPRVNIQKIRKAIQVNHQQQNFLENVDYFIGSNLPRKSRQQTRNQNVLERLLGRRESDSGRQVEKQNGSKQHLSSQLYMNRYKAPNTTRNNFVHYVPKNIEMQTMIQPRKKYFNRTNPLESPVYKYQFENSNGSSKVSQVSTYSRKRNNLSALY